VNADPVEVVAVNVVCVVEVAVCLNRIAPPDPVIAPTFSEQTGAAGKAIGKTTRTVGAAANDPEPLVIVNSFNCVY